MSAAQLAELADAFRLPASRTTDLRTNADAGQDTSKACARTFRYARDGLAGQSSVYGAVAATVQARVALHRRVG